VNLTEVRVNALMVHSEAMDRLATKGAQGMIKIKRVYDTPTEKTESDFSLTDCGQ
jgi:hypothetical protein